ncbi:unnamed protein product [Rhizophagus irregularis]|uniref:Uncharacterized protein n=1 Tax=Rhizophagus irregularis TaxID=588596 RepID=A0A916E541_9GLOM|nr:unnamed protein product [Rhizophagus irregularis]
MITLLIIACCTELSHVHLMKWFLNIINSEFFFPFVLWILQKEGNVFEDTPLLRMLIDDMGGNGRALGALELAVKDFKSFENINFLSIAETVFYQLKCHYGNWN